MPMKKFQVTFKSKKTAHPLGDVEHEYFIVSTTKKLAAKIGLESLKEQDPSNYELYKAPVISVVDTQSVTTAPSKEESIPELTAESIPESILEPESDAEIEYFYETGTYDMPNFIYHSANGISSSMVKKPVNQ